MADLSQYTEYIKAVDQTHGDLYIPAVSSRLMTWFMSESESTTSSNTETLPPAREEEGEEEVEKERRRERRRRAMYPPTSPVLPP